MNRFVWLNTLGDKDIAVRITDVKRIIEVENGNTQVQMDNGKDFFVTQSVEEVLEAMGELEQAEDEDEDDDSDEYALVRKF
jgi:uncharacterized protein YlzI (FlbEa/FlbD family)